MSRNLIFMAFLYVFNFLVLDSALCQSGLRSIFENHKSGFIDTTGKIIIKPTFDAVNEFCNGLAWFSDSGKTGYIDTKGNKVFISPYAFSEFHEGLVAFFKGGKLGFFNKKGEIAFYPRFKNFILGCDLVSSGIPYFSEGLASVIIAKGDTSNWLNDIFINRKGVNAFGDRSFASADNFSEGLAFVILDNGENGYINHKGELAINLEQGKRGEEFSEGFAVINMNDSSNIAYYINKKGEWLGSSLFERADAFSDGMAKVRINDKWGFINTNGDIVIDPIYNENSGEFSEGLAPVSLIVPSKTDKWRSLTYVINYKGEIVLGPYENVIIQTFRNGLARFIRQRSDLGSNCSEDSYINKKGKIVWEGPKCAEISK